MEEIVEITITTDYITLGQFLKFAGIVDRGSDAKAFLLEADIEVDGEKESRRGRKLRGGELVRIDGQAFRIVR